MARKFNNKYRVDTTRNPNWDYNRNGSYFITICTKNRIPYLGKFINNTFELSTIGKIAMKCWFEIPEHFPFVKLNAFIVMHDHIHGIINIDKPTVEAQYFAPNTQNKTSNHNKETQYFAPLSKRQKKNYNVFGPQSMNLASIIRGYKIGVSKYAKNNAIEFAWQKRYYDHIIWDKRSYIRISKYILNNEFHHR